MTNYDKLRELARKLGMETKIANSFVRKLADDERAFPVSEDQKRWAMERGFFPGRIALYGLSEGNYRDYLPDWSYFMLHPLNHHFRLWINDKLTLRYVLGDDAHRDLMPKYYLYVENDGSYTYLTDAPADIKKDKDFIKNLLWEKGILAVKPNSGTCGGIGFMKLEIRDGVIFENNCPIDGERFSEILRGLGNHIVTEYVHQHGDLARIWDGSECTLRVIMVKDPKDDPAAESTWSNVVSYARFGTLASKGASNLSSGGIGVGFNFETGEFCDTAIRYKKFCPDGVTTLRCHPDSGVVWKGEKLPNWTFVKEKLESVCRHISSLSYLGFDVIISNRGMVLCEINTHPACDYEQIMCGPLLAKENAKRFYESHGMNNFDPKELYDAYMKSQE